MAKSRKVTGGAGWTLLPPDPEPGPAATPKAPAKPVKVRVTVEKRPGGRMVTRLTGLAGMAEADVADWLKRLKATFGAGGTCGPDWLELQGDRVEALREAARKRGLKL